jgi:hypothetical protein
MKVESYNATHISLISQLSIYMSPDNTEIYLHAVKSVHNIFVIQYVQYTEQEQSIMNLQITTQANGYSQRYYHSIHVHCVKQEQGEKLASSLFGEQDTAPSGYSKIDRWV